MSDPVGGLIRTETQRGWMRCENLDMDPRLCATTEHVQLTIGNDGSAVICRYMSASGWLPNSKDSLFTEHEWAQLRKSTDDFLSFIVGKSKSAPAHLSFPSVDPI